MNDVFRILDPGINILIPVLDKVILLNVIFYSCEASIFAFAKLNIK